MGKSIRDKLCERAEEHMLSKHEASAVADKLAALPEMAEMHGRWNDAADGYPTVLLNALWLAYCSEADKWLASTKPKHFARQMLSGYLPKRDPEPEANACDIPLRTTTLDSHHEMVLMSPGTSAVLNTDASLGVAATAAFAGIRVPLEAVRALELQDAEWRRGKDGTFELHRYSPFKTRYPTDRILCQDLQLQAHLQRELIDKVKIVQFDPAALVRGE